MPECHDEFGYSIAMRLEEIEYALNDIEWLLLRTRLFTWKACRQDDYRTELLMAEGSVIRLKRTVEKLLMETESEGGDG